MRASTPTHTSTTSTRYPSKLYSTTDGKSEGKPTRITCRQVKGAKSEQFDMQDLLRPRGYPAKRVHRSKGLMIPLHHATPAAIIMAQCPIRTSPRLALHFVPRGSKRDSHCWDRGPSKGRRRIGQEVSLGETPGLHHRRRGREGTLIPRSFAPRRNSSSLFLVVLL